MNSLVSIIVPIYKAEFVISRCIESLLKQTYENIEIILINDGSPDNSGQICEDFALKDSRVKIFHKENGGVSSARNYGIDLALGDYICFVDSDDTVSQYYVERFLKSINNFGAELAVSSFKIYGFKNCKDILIENHLYNTSNLRKEEKIGMLFDGIMFSPWNKIFLKSIIIENRIRFDTDIHYSEDAVFVFEYLEHCNKIAFINDVLYNYDVSFSSNASNKYYPKMNRYLLKRFRAQLRLLDIYSIDDDEKNNLKFSLAADTFMFLTKHYLFKNYNKDQVLFIYEQAYEEYSLYLDLLIDNKNLEVKYNFNNIQQWVNKYKEFLAIGDIEGYYKSLYRDNYWFNIIQTLKMNIRGKIACFLPIRSLES